MEEDNIYIYHLPLVERQQLCTILDQNNVWEKLASTHMQYDITTIYLLRQKILRGKSPADELLTLWGQQNHTVLELFILLNRMKHYQGMIIIKQFVPALYHKLIKPLAYNINQPLEDETENKPSVQTKNVQKLLEPSPLKVVTPTKDVNYVTRDDNGSVEPNKLLKPVLPQVRDGGTSRASTIYDISCVAESAGAIPQIQYEELQKSTDNWSQANILGKGGFGIVFKGTWKCTKVAIKRIEQRENSRESYIEQMKQSVTELHCLNAYRHDNILPLYGYSIGGAQPCLVYQYMSGGSLDSRLRIVDPRKVLQWRKRLDVAIGSARGLQYLHTIGEKPLIHGDIKSANILLDHNDVPRIGDFGLAREGPQSDFTHVTVSRIHGTRPYLPDEFLRGGKLSTKVDTYSFGVVLFELATGLRAYSERRKYKFLKDHVVLHEGDITELMEKKIEGDDGCFQGWRVLLVNSGKQTSALYLQNDISGNENANLFEPSLETGKKVSEWTVNSQVNPEELGEYFEGDIVLKGNFSVKMDWLN
ncbi:Protein tyrosine and serine/threonine kinase [Popillia japonica]|uniref:non-specific serine/threonine protein kinase n=1 Tax=Popillia japonica TaxID=7064 RepID=A0AAW1MZH0_POPJA